MTGVVQNFEIGAKSVFDTFKSFLDKHTSDLTALSTAITGLLAALPVNSGTRSAISSALGEVTTSAENIKDWLDNSPIASDAQPVVNISETDLQAAVSSQVSSYLSSALPSLVSSAVSDYFTAHPVAAPALATEPVAETEQPAS